MQQKQLEQLDAFASRVVAAECEANLARREARRLAAVLGRLTISKSSDGADDKQQLVEEEEEGGGEINVGGQMESNELLAPMREVIGPRQQRPLDQLRGSPQEVANGRTRLLAHRSPLTVERGGGRQKSMSMRTPSGMKAPFR
jgi:hypothetical protein